MEAPIPRRVVPSAKPAELGAAQVAREFRRLVAAGLPIRPAGEAKRRPLGLLSGGYTPKFKVELFDTVFYLTRIRQNEDLRFFVAYVVQGGRRGRAAYPRIFYKDVSLIWRSASHFVRSEGENWIGKGELREEVHDGVTLEVSAEETTDLPLELQPALEELSRRSGRIPYDQSAIERVLRRGGDDRMDPYRDFTDPRRRARANPRNLVNGGRPVATLTRRNDPGSLRFVPGFEPDFRHGVLEVDSSHSKLYGGSLRRYRILSKNQEIQYLFFAGPHHVWIIPPQATTTELSSYGVRTIDVLADEELCIPGYEYHFLDDTEDPPVFVSQIPEGYAGPASEVDDSRADASRWLDGLPVVKQFRREVLEGGQP